VRRIRDALSNARITGITPWQALGRLARTSTSTSLRDLSAALALVADDGRRCGSRSPPAGQHAQQGCPTSKERPVNAPSPCSWRNCCWRGLSIFLAYPAVMRVIAS